MTESMWTRFMDMHSGGGRKVSHEYVLIEAPRGEAELIFQNRFGRNPNRVTCTCCGPDYCIESHEDLCQLTAFDRGCDYEDGKYVERQSTAKFRSGSYRTLSEYLASDEALVIRADEIRPDERRGELHEEGYVWRD